jgi:hypothetical protein
MLYDNMSSVSQNVLKFYQQLTAIPVTDGHGETSIPPYNFVVGGKTNTKCYSLLFNPTGASTHHLPHKSSRQRITPPIHTVVYSMIMF